MIGEIGGFNDAILIIFEFVMSYYGPSLFMTSMVKSLFPIDRFKPVRRHHRGYGQPHVIHPPTKADNQLLDAKKRLVKQIQSGFVFYGYITDMIKLVARRKRIKVSTFAAFIGDKLRCLRNFYTKSQGKDLLALRKGYERVEKVMDIKTLNNLQ